MRIKQLLGIAAGVIAWSAVALYGAVAGWWLTPIAPKGDSRAFVEAAIAIAKAQSRGNVALVLIRDGDVFAEHFTPSVDRVDRETRFPLASMSKWFTAYATMELVQAGRVALDTPAATYLKRWQLPSTSFDNRGVTVSRLLSHTAGLTDGLGFGDYTAQESLPSLTESLRQPRASSGVNALIAVGREPGKEFQYSGGGYLVLQSMLEDVTGQPFDVWMQDSVLRPIGMSRASYQYLGQLDNASKSYDANGKLAPTYRYAAAAATGLSASASDLVAFVQAHVRADRAVGPLLSQATLARMREPHARKSGIDIWGLGVMLFAPTKGGAYVYGHDGANTSAINTTVRINPDNGDAIIVLVTGNPTLASRLGYEWTLWQTGVSDFLMVEKALRSAIVPWLVGLLGIAALIGLRGWRSRRA